MRTLETIAPIPYRQQNAGDYHIPSMQLRADLGPQHASGFALHFRDQSEGPDGVVRAS